MTKAQQDALYCIRTLPRCALLFDYAKQIKRPWFLLSYVECGWKAWSSRKRRKNNKSPFQYSLAPTAVYV
jgi:hypothetical protein